MTKAMFVYTTEGARYALLKGHLRDWLKETSTPAMWSPSNRGWHVRAERVPDLVARAERDGFRVRVKAVSQ